MPWEIDQGNNESARPAPNVICRLLPPETQLSRRSLPATESAQWDVPDYLVHGFRISSHIVGKTIQRPLHGYACGSAFQFSNLVCREFNFSRSNVFVQAMQLGGARNGNDPRLLRKQPRESHLPWRYLLLFRKIG